MTLPKPEPAMTFSVFVPDHEPGTKLPVIWYLSGLTCTHANVTEKGEFRVPVPNSA
jgi:S-formylglutathione hydrolase